MSGLSVVLTRLGGFILGGGGFFLRSGTWVVFGVGLARLVGWLHGGCGGVRGLLGDRFLVTGLLSLLLVTVVLGVGVGLGFGGGGWLLVILGVGLGGTGVVLELSFSINWCIRFGFCSRFAPSCKVWCLGLDLGFIVGVCRVFLVLSITLFIYSMK